MSNLQNSALLTNINGEQRISSEVIAESIGTVYKATNNLIRKYLPELEEFGEVHFEKAVGQRKKLAYLDENQAIFLMTLSKNTKVVVSFKLQLVKEFSRLKRKQAIIDARHAKVEWQERRSIGIVTRHTQTDIIQEFLAYAGNQGSTNYPIRGYSMITRMVNTALHVVDRDDCPEDELALIATADTLVAKVLTSGMENGLAYKNIYKQCRAKIHDLADVLDISVG